MTTVPASNPGEIWLPLMEHPTAWVSSHGRLFRQETTINCFRDGGPLTSTSPAKFLGGTRASTKGYPRVNIGKRVQFIHRLIATYFAPNPNNLLQVNHIDGNKRNNRANNLEWATNQENRDHAVTHGLVARGEAVGTARLTEDTVRQIRAAFCAGTRQKDLMTQFELSQSLIHAIVRRKTWAHVEEGPICK